MAGNLDKPFDKEWLIMTQKLLVEKFPGHMATVSQQLTAAVIDRFKAYMSQVSDIQITDDMCTALRKVMMPGIVFMHSLYFQKEIYELWLQDANDGEALCLFNPEVHEDTACVEGASVDVHSLDAGLFPGVGRIRIEDSKVVSCYRPSQPRSCSLEPC